MKKHSTEIYCWKIQVEDLNIVMASSKRGAIHVHLDLEPELDALTYFENRFQRHLVENAEVNEPLTRAIEARLMNKPIHHDLSFDMSSTPFQMRTWRTVARIPFGQTRTYGDVAKRIGKPGGARAIGQAMNRNPLPLIFP
jgi:O6-methylguanine-DNA--protein-cysteine methyltransferase